jgi:hypothetical protein
MRRLHQLASAAEGQAIDCRNDRLWKRLDAPSHLMAWPHEMHNGLRRTSLKVALKPRDIGPGAEGAPSAGNHNYPYPGIEFNLIQGVHNRCEQLIAERIEFAGSVQREECDGSAVLPPQNENALSVFRSHRSTSFTAGGRRTVGRFRANGPTIGLA